MMNMIMWLNKLNTKTVDREFKHGNVQNPCHHNVDD